MIWCTIINPFMNKTLCSGEGEKNPSSSADNIRDLRKVEKRKEYSFLKKMKMCWEAKLWVIQMKIHAHKMYSWVECIIFLHMIVVLVFLANSCIHIMNIKSIFKLKRNSREIENILRIFELFLLLLSSYNDEQEREKKRSRKFLYHFTLEEFHLVGCMSLKFFLFLTDTWHRREIWKMCVKALFAQEKKNISHFVLFLTAIKYISSHVEILHRVYET